MPVDPEPLLVQALHYAPAVAPELPVRDEAPGLCTIATLGSHMCKWPIGDPQDDSFTCCGQSMARGPYCDHHALVAFQPARERTPAQKLADEERRMKGLLRMTRRFAA